MKKIIIFTLITIIVLGCFNGCAFKGDEKNNDFTLAYLGIDILNPAWSQSNIDHSVLYLLQIQLIRLFDGKIVCDAAEKYDVSDDYLTYTFCLRDNLTWSDGVELTAFDFEYGVYCLLAPEMGSPRASGWYAINNAEKFATGAAKWEDVGVKAIDKKTICFSLNQPLSDFDKSIACKHIYPLRKDFVEAKGIDKLGATPESLLYSGPYVMTSRQNCDLVLEKNDKYWDHANAFPTEIIKFIKVDDANTQLAMFENNDVDAIQHLSSQYNKHLEKYLYTVAGGGVEFLWVNQNGKTEETGKLLSNINFRKALSYSINRNELVKATNSANLPVNNIIDPGFVGPGGGRFIDEYPVDAVPLDGNHTVAREYLNAALSELGYKDISELPAIEIVTFPGEGYKLECEALIDQWRQILGIESVTFRQYDVGLAIDTFYNTSYDVFVISWESDVRPTDIMESLMTGGEANAGIWSNPVFDQLVTAAVNETNPIQKAKMTNAAEQVFLDDFGIIPIYILNTVSAVQSYVSGYQTGSIDGYEFDYLKVEK